MGIPLSSDCKIARDGKLPVLLVLLIVVAVVVAAAYLPALSSNALMFDDDQYLTENRLVQNPSWQSVKRFFTEVLKPSTVRGYYQPFAMVSLMGDVALGGSEDNLMVFRLTSLSLHIANTILVAVFLYILFGSAIVAAALALLYGLAPVNIESVVWLSERKMLLAAFFALWSLICYVLYTRKGRAFILAASCLLFVFSLLSKPAAIAMPILLLLMDFWPLHRLNRRAVIEKTPFFLIAIAFAFITFISQQRAASVKIPTQSGLINLLLIPCHNIIFYLRNLVWPTNLSWYYPYPEPFGLSSPMVLAGLVGSILLVLAVVVSLRWHRAIFTGFFFFFAAILPVIGIVSVHPAIAADRHLYFPLVGILLPAGYFLSRLRVTAAACCGGLKRRIVLLIILLAVVCFEFVSTRIYLSYWKDSETLYKYMLSKSPNVFILHNNFANILKNTGKINESINHFYTSLKLKSNSPVVHNNLANALSQINRPDKAVEHYLNAIKLKPDFAVAHFNLATVYEEQAKTDKAITEYRLALKFKHDYAEALSNLGFIMAGKGQYTEAVDYYNKALKLSPDSVISHGRLALALAQLGRTQEAIEHCKFVLKHRPRDVQMLCNVGILLQKQGKIDMAVTYYRRALQIDPDYATARKMLQSALLLIQSDAGSRQSAWPVGK